ncbi:MAG TPA: DUF2892 domain-containing protein [Chitinophagaceae bacterium]|jgi:uncharacterized membrane protein HdeD (DUF308 family)|nr:DUF2892 domain-containing protein [Chitinophagaceae bacterium]
MKKNIGLADRIIRIVVGVLLGYFYFGNVLAGTAGIVSLAAGAILILTSLVSFCPLYAIFGLNTCSAKKTGTS